MKSLQNPVPVQSQMDAEQCKSDKWRAGMHHSPERSWAAQVHPWKIDRTRDSNSTEYHKGYPGQQYNIENIIQSGSPGASGEKTNRDFLYPVPVKNLMKDKKKSDYQTGPFMKTKAVKWSRVHQQKHWYCDSERDKEFYYVHAFMVKLI